MREKLIKVLFNAHNKVTDASLFDDATYAQQIEIEADYLIGNGVTFVTDKNVGNKWIPVSERLPERNTEVLVCDTKEKYVSVWEYIGDGLWLGNEIIWATEDITHWMPLPEPPKEEP